MVFGESFPCPASHPFHLLSSSLGPWGSRTTRVPQLVGTSAGASLSDSEYWLSLAPKATGLRGVTPSLGSSPGWGPFQAPRRWPARHLSPSPDTTTVARIPERESSAPAPPNPAHPPVSAPESTQSSSSPPAFGFMARVPAALPPPRVAPSASYPGPATTRPRVPAARRALSRPRPPHPPFCAARARPGATQRGPERVHGWRACARAQA